MVGAVEVFELETPLLTVDPAVLQANIDTMAAWCAERGVLLAPHGKTTMAPEIWRAQLDAGAWGITVANAQQLAVAVDAGIERIVVANQLLSAEGLRLAAASGAICWVDSLAGVRLMAERAVGVVDVCVELGAVGARTGVRDDAVALEICRAVVAEPSLRLRGVSGYEGSVPGADRVAAVREFLRRMRAVYEDGLELFEDPLITAGGSAFFDLVVEEFAGLPLVLRSGAYVLHDDVLYAGSTPSATRSGPVFQAASTLWARVVSVPEPGLAIVDAGKRDVAYDAGLPVLRAVFRGDDIVPGVVAEMTNTNDQHGYLAVSSGELRVGDVLELGQSHPCTIADKRRVLTLASRLSPTELTMVGSVPTFFE
ncbi:alanine racemase [Microbacteriaceae bacterium VKM Ac-2854]|nr:alanine racemase [Microbacteriaceae bacterium VKM Ac-2854]